MNTIINMLFAAADSVGHVELPHRGMVRVDVVDARRDDHALGAGNGAGVFERSCEGWREVSRIQREIRDVDECLIWVARLIQGTVHLAIRF